jgi:hypothetical protein
MQGHGSETVIGHWVRASDSVIQAVNAWSTPLFQAIVRDELRALEGLLSGDADPGEAQLARVGFRSLPRVSIPSSRRAGGCFAAPVAPGDGQPPPAAPHTDVEYLVLCWGSENSGQEDVDGGGHGGGPQVQVQRRTLLDLAVYHGAYRCASYLLARGANPTHRSSDGLTAYDVSAGVGG